MERDSPRHEKIRFRRDEITDLATLPSCAGLDPDLFKRSRWSRARRAALAILAGVGSLIALAVAGVIIVSVFGIGSERLRLEAEKAIEAIAGVDIVAAVGPARLTLDGSHFLAVEARDVSFKNASDGADIIDAGVVRFGFRFLPLLTGNLRLSSATFGDARIVASALPTRNIDWAASLRNAEGLIDPDKLAEGVFAAVNGALDAVQTQSTRTIALENIEFVLPESGSMRQVRIVEATLAESGSGSLDLSAETEIDGRAVRIAATAQRDPVSRRITSLQLTAVSPTSAQSEVGAATKNNGLRIGSANLKISGAEGTGAEPAALKADLTMKGSEVDLGARGILAGDIDLTASLVAGAGRIEVQKLLVTAGRSILDFNGIVTPQAGSEAGGKPAYRFGLLSRRSTISPDGSPEPALNAQIRVEGNFEPVGRVLNADRILLKSSGPGEALGAASIELVEGKSPGLSAAFSVHDMSVSHVKQLWPWFAARPARLWVLENLFGGRVSDGRIQFKVEPGRLGNGIPLSGNEVFGTVALSDTRFDTAGLIPPVRDAVGSVDFRGNDVDISLTSGTVFMPSGRTVAASNGTLTIKKANIRPVIGKLNIDVAGNAPAITELASYDPINAMRFIGFSPEDFVGEVSGNVKADIPLHKGIDSGRLGWLVALDYKNLSLAKPVDGQMITEADGSIVVEPGKAVISTKARLSGVPAEIDLVEPLGKSKTERQRKVVLVLDEKGRETLVPGLSGLLDGTVKVSLDLLGKGRHKVSADLTAAKLDIPWAGWTKGPGIAAQVDFILEKEGDKSTLSDFNLSGKTFAVDGTVSLSQGSLSSARFSNVRLNRGDDVAVSIKQTGKGYAIDINGNALDARSLIKQFTSDVDTATKANQSGSVSVTATVKSLTGFHGEQLSNLKLDYSGSGAKVNGLQVSASTKSGATVQIKNTSESGGRTMQMQSTDAGAVLRFLDIYKNMEGGAIKLSLAGGPDGPMSGQIDARDFWVVNEPRLSSIVSSPPPGDNRSLNQAVKRDIDTSRVKFERGFTEISKGDGRLTLANGILRGQLIGATFQGTLYDKAGNMDMTGTFMPAYGLNRLFGEVPLIGIILGNGRDGGLIGVTFKLSGDADAPTLQVNPLSVIAPGIFRSIFEFQ